MQQQLKDAKEKITQLESTKPNEIVVTSEVGATEEAEKPKNEAGAVGQVHPENDNSNLEKKTESEVVTPTEAVEESSANDEVHKRSDEKQDTEKVGTDQEQEQNPPTEPEPENTRSTRSGRRGTPTEVDNPRRSTRGQNRDTAEKSVEEEDAPNKRPKRKRGNQKQDEEDVENA